MNLGTSEILLIAFVIFIFFGAKRLPEIARSLGKGIGEFKKATKEIQSELNVQVDEYERQQYREQSQLNAPQPPVGQTQARQSQTTQNPN